MGIQRAKRSMVYTSGERVLVCVGTAMIQQNELMTLQPHNGEGVLKIGSVPPTVGEEEMFSNRSNQLRGLALIELGRASAQRLCPSFQPRCP